MLSINMSVEKVKDHFRECYKKWSLLNKLLYRWECIVFRLELKVRLLYEKIKELIWR